MLSKEKGTISRDISVNHYNKKQNSTILLKQNLSAFIKHNPSVIIVFNFHYHGYFCLVYVLGHNSSLTFKSLSPPCKTSVINRRHFNYSIGGKGLKALLTTTRLNEPATIFSGHFITLAGLEHGIYQQTSRTLQEREREREQILVSMPKSPRY